jgi:voltage-gated potassium channel Kch
VTLSLTAHVDILKSSRHGSIVVRKLDLWGTVDDDVLSHLINPTSWVARDGLRQAFQVVRSPRGFWLPAMPSDHSTRATDQRT